MSAEDAIDEAGGDPSPRKRAWGRYIVTRGVALVLALAILGLVVLDTSIGHRFIADQVARLEPENGLRIRIGRIEGSVYSQASLRDVSLSDPDGVFLTVPETELDWRPFHWFFSGLDIRDLTAKRGMLLRLPDLNPSDPDKPLLPDYDIRVDRLRLLSFTVAEGVAGAKRKVELTARANKRPGRALLKLDGKLGGTDRLHVLLDSQPRQDRFDLDVDYRAPAGGLLAGLAGSRRDMAVRVAGKGTWTAWDGTLKAEHDKQSLASLALKNRKGHYGLNGTLHPARLVQGKLADLLGQTVSLTADATLADSVLDGTLAMKGRAVTFDARGAADLSRNETQGLVLRFVLTQPDALGGNIRAEGAKLTVRFDGPFRNLDVPHDLQIARLDAGAGFVRLQQTGVLHYDGKRWTLPLNLTVAQVETGSGTADPLLAKGKATGELVLDGGQLRSDDLRLSFPGLTSRLSLRGDTRAGGYALGGPVTVRGLTFTDLGTFDGDAKLLAKFAQGSGWLVKANFAGHMPQVANTTLASVTGGNIRFRGGIGLGSGRETTFDALALEAAKLELHLDGSSADGTMHLAGQGQHADYGAFTVDADLLGDGPHAELVFASPLPAAGLKQVRVALAPIEDGFGIDTSGQSLLGPFDGSLALHSRKGEPTRLAVRRMEVSQSTISGGLILGEGGASGKLAVAGGGMDGALALEPRGGGQGFDLALDGKNARFAGSTPMLVRTAHVEARGVLGGDRAEAKGSLFAQGISHGQLFIGRVAARGDVADGKGTFNASVAGRRGGRFGLQMLGTVSPGQMTLAAQGEFADRRIAMPRRAILTKADGAWRLAPVQVSYGDGIAIAEGRFGGGGMDLDLKLADMSLSLFDIALTDLSLGGKVSGLVEFHATDGAPSTGKAQVKVEGLTRSGLVLSSRPVDLYLVADLSPEILQTRAAIREGGERRGRLQARISALPRFGSFVERLSAGSLFGQLRYAGPADSVWRLAAIDGFDLTGPVDLAADVTGTIADPRVRGSLASDGLRFRSSITGTDISKISARGSFAGSRLNLTRFEGEARNGGGITGSGMIDLADLDKHGPQMDLRLSAAGALVLDRKDMSAKVTGPMRIVSDGNGGTIAGRLTVDEANWRLGSASVVAELPDIATREANLPADVAPRTTRIKPWRYLIDAKGNNRLYVRGMGLDSEWSADIALRGTTRDPRIGGQAQMVRGTYEFAGSRFDLTHGRIAFDADAPPDPQLDIQAESDVDNLSVRVTVKGSASQPEIAFNSTPALPEEELLARLLFGGSVSDLSPTDALQLGSALASLRGGGGLDPINRLRKAIGLDRLRIVSADPTQGQGTAISAGKYINRKLYAEIVTDGRGYSATQLEFRVTGWLSLLGSVSTLGRESVQAKISRDY